MSKCKVEQGQKRKHVYTPGTNVCSVCQHKTKKGKNWRLVTKALAK